MRKAILKLLLRKLPQNKLPKKLMLQMFGMEHVPKRVTLQAPMPMMQVHDDK